MTNVEAKESVLTCTKAFTVIAKLFRFFTQGNIAINVRTSKFFNNILSYNLTI